VYKFKVIYIFYYTYMEQEMTLGSADIQLITQCLNNNNDDKNNSVDVGDISTFNLTLPLVNEETICNNNKPTPEKKIKKKEKTSMKKKRKSNEVTATATADVVAGTTISNLNETLASTPFEDKIENEIKERTSKIGKKVKKGGDENLGEPKKEKGGKKKNNPGAGEEKNLKITQDENVNVNVNVEKKKPKKEKKEVAEKVSKIKMSIKKGATNSAEEETKKIVLDYMIAVKIIFFIIFKLL
jgi:hypothetical protein